MIGTQAPDLVPLQLGQLLGRAKAQLDTATGPVGCDARGDAERPVETVDGVVRDLGVVPVGGTSPVPGDPEPTPDVEIMLLDT